MAEILDVTLRDGLQDEPVIVATALKREIAERVMRSGVAGIEATSFVSPTWVPQLADAEALMVELTPLLREHPEVFVTALVPNVRGYERATRAGCKVVTVVMSATESHNVSNLNMSRRQSLDTIRDIVRDAHGKGIRVRGALSTAFGCPFEGPANPVQVASAIEEYLDTGVDELSLADTVGLGTSELVRAIVAGIDDLSMPIWLHFHDRFHQALANVRAGLEAGITRFEATLAGLGGCPFAPDAPGNVNVLTLARFLEVEGVACRVDAAVLARLETDIAEILVQAEPAPDRQGRSPPSDAHSR